MRRRIASTGRDPASVRIVAVTKTFGVDARARGASRTVWTDVGENYVDELEEKRADSRPRFTWHFLGALQSNKIARVVALRRRHRDGVAARRRSRRSPPATRASALYVQVDYTGASDAQRGRARATWPDLVERARELDSTCAAS